MPKEMKRKVFSEKKKGGILSLLAEDTVSVRLLPSLTFLRQQFIRTSSRHWEQQSYSLAEAENHSPLTGMTVTSFTCQGCHKVTQKTCDRLVESMPRHMRDVTANQGYSTKY